MKWMQPGGTKTGSRLTRWRFPSRRHGEYGIHSDQSFRSLILRERARVDRNSHCLSLVSFDVDAALAQDIYLKDFVKVLLQHVRFTDEIGWNR